MVDEIGRSEYAFSPLPDGSWSAPNRAHDLRARVSSRDVEVRSRRHGSDAHAGGWTLKLTLAAWGREGHLETIDDAAVRVDEGRATLARRAVTEWYANDGRGLEQGFAVHAPPADGSPELPVVLAMTLEGGLGAYPSADGREIVFKTASGRAVLRYGALKVTDALGAELAAALRVRPGRLEIRIHDREAVYPITVDPLLTSPDWTAESNQNDAQFGTSVAAAGDVNGDGFSDVIVGAPFFDGGQTDEGRAYVFLGSASGLATSAAWTAESDQASAQFGTSVAAAGDVNGDGFADVAVGSPFHGNGQSNEGRVFVWFGGASGLGANGNPGNADWSAESDQANAELGLAVASAGDVDGDGYDDLIVGAPFFDNGQTDEGRVFLWLGSASGPGAAGTPANADWSAQSDQANAHLGIAVASAGDVDGDGFADVVLGAPLYDGGQTDEGRALLWRGSASGLGANGTPANADWSAEANQAGAEFAFSVAGAGDVDGDGFGDVLVGAHGYDNGESGEGRAFLFKGSASGPAATAAWTAESDLSGARFGYSVATAGDVNGDGYADVVVGADSYDNGDRDEGRAYLFQGSASGLAAAPASIVESDQRDAFLGRSVGAAGDVDGDGFGDVLVGAPLYDNGNSEEGRAFLFRGTAANLAGSPTLSVEPDVAFSLLGYSLASAGDVNGDGFGDVIVGAPLYDNGESDEGRVFVFLGSAAGLSPVPAWTAESDQAGAELGYSVASAGDVNGDGYSDVIAGAFLYDNVPIDEGRALLWLGGPGGLGPNGTPGNADWSAESNQFNAQLGSSVAAAGDVNGDGYGDVIVASFAYDNGEIDEGRVFVWYGGAGGLGADGTPLNADWFAESNQANAVLGTPVASAGDVNGDGYSDVIAGAYLYDNGQNNEGRAFAWYGGPSGLGPNGTPANADWSAESNQADALFGFPLASAGDVDGDGYSDVIIGATAYDNGDVDEGRAYLYRGSPTGLSPSPSWTAENDQPASAFGYVRASAGDVNGDGYSDLVIGAPYADNVQIDEGAVYLYLGSASGPTASPAWTFEVDSQNSLLGYASGTAGDVNGDGFGDVIVGAHSYSNFQVNEGRMLLFAGNAGLGAPRSPRQMRTDGTTPIDILGKADSQTSFRLQASGRTPAGRGRIRMQWEVKPLGAPLDGTGVQQSAAVDTGFPTGAGSVIPFDQGIDSLVIGMPYHWRLRFTADSPLFPRSPWISLAYNAPSETDLRMALCVDLDGDGYGFPGHPLCPGGSAQDCNDANPAAYPGAPELCDNADNDCDGTVDGFPTSCGVGGCARQGACTGGTDSCSPGSPTPEICDNVDNDCDGTVDLFVSTCGVGACLRHGNCAAGNDTCAPGPPTGEVCNGLDDDCDGTVDNGVLLTFYRDVDGDGFGNAGVTTLACSAPGGYVATPGDCDDAEATVWATPGETLNLLATHSIGTGTTALAWSPPNDLGGVPASVRYDTLRSAAASDFGEPAASCLESSGADTASDEPEAPPPGSAFFYLTRARNACPQGVGTLGRNSAGVERAGRECVPPCVFSGSVSILPASSPPDLDPTPKTVTVNASGTDTFVSAHLVIVKEGGATDLDETQATTGTAWNFSWTPGQGAGTYTATATVLNDEACPGSATNTWQVVIAPCTTCATIVAQDPNPTGGGSRYYRQQNSIQNACSYPLRISGVAIRARSTCATCASPLKLLKVQYLQSGTFSNETSNVVYTAPGTGDNVSTSQTASIDFSASPLTVPASSTGAKIRFIFSTATPIWVGTSASQKSVLEGDFTFGQASGFCLPSTLANQKLEVTP